MTRSFGVWWMHLKDIPTSTARKKLEDEGWELQSHWMRCGTILWYKKEGKSLYWHPEETLRACNFYYIYTVRSHKPVI